MTGHWLLSICKHDVADAANRVNSKVDSPGSCAEAEDLRMQEQLIPEGPVMSLHFLYQWVAIMQWVVLGKFGILKPFWKVFRVTSTASTLKFPKTSSMKQLGCSYCFEKITQAPPLSQVFVRPLGQIVPRQQPISCGYKLSQRVSAGTGKTEKDSQNK